MSEWRIIRTFALYRASMINFIIGVVAFIYILHRISRVERMITGQRKDDRDLASSQERSISPTISVKTAPVNIPESSGEVSSTSESHKLEPSIPPATGVNRIASSDELAVGTKVFTSVGVVALFLGVGFFLRYAFENNLVSEQVRVILGLLTGLILGITGHLFRKKYEKYGYALVGGGLGIVYISTYAAYGFYSLIPSVTAFVFLAVLSALGIIISLSYKSFSLNIYALAGAYLVPCIMPLSLQASIVFPYLLILAIGVSVIARFRKWPLLSIGSLLATTIVSYIWLLPNQIYQVYLGSYIEVGIYFFSIFFIYLLSTIINYSHDGEETKDSDALLLYGVPTIYFLLNLPLLSEDTSIPTMLLGIAIFYAIGSVIIRTFMNTNSRFKTLSNGMAVISAVALVGATISHFDGSTLTLLLALEAVLIFVIGTFSGSMLNRIIAIILAMVSGIKLLVFDMFMVGDVTAIWNIRSLSFVVVLMPYLVMWWLYRFVEIRALTEDEKNAGKGIGSIGLFLLPLIWLTAEAELVISDYEVYLPIIWSLFAFMGVSLSFITQERVFRYLAYVLCMLVPAYILITLWTLPNGYYYLIMNVRTYGVIVFILVLFSFTKILNHYTSVLSDTDRAFRQFTFPAISLFLLWFISLEIIDYFNLVAVDSLRYGEQLTIESTKRVVLSFSWLIYASICLAIGIIKRFSFARYFSISLFLLTIAKILVYDTSNFSDIYRFISFGILGVIMLISGYAYYRFKDRIIQFVDVENKQDPIRID